MSDFQALFESIRDIPYRLASHATDTPDNCVRKGLLLADKLVMAGMTVRGRIGEFDWSSTPFPAEIVALYPRDIPATHFYLEVLEDGGWRALDLSWDKGLAGAGFKLASWDGKNSPGISLTRLYTLEEQAEYLQKWQDEKLVEDYFARAGAFLEAANAWLLRVRNS